ncbi:hypothetical protein B4U80_14389 [Leptotrombidium deliense]|uniref:CCHC-type domain-containing protein n=1 Tax=Leptotrombidium deliense TaxID=299467 RepID=A0A443RWR6_9ACAR|nr:hypothetical protein B4U80_14389 [Leptotrombidium deliense]
MQAQIDSLRRVNQNRGGAQQKFCFNCGRGGHVARDCRQRRQYNSRGRPNYNNPRTFENNGPHYNRNRSANGGRSHEMEYRPQSPRQSPNRENFHRR